MSDFEPIPYRVRIGVTGHRSIPDEAATEALVKKAIDSEIEGLFSDESRQSIERVRRQGTTPIRYSVVTTLAEGADRLVARAVCSYDGARLDAVLPLSLADYLDDFKTEKSREEFEDLLFRSRRPVHLRHNRFDTEARIPEEATRLRREAYERGGHYVVSHCDVLIAIWDGQQARGRGGTAEIVEFAVAQLRPVIRVWDGSYEVFERAHGLDATSLDAIDRFNRAPVMAEQRALYVKNLDRDYFETPASAKEIPPEAREIVRRHLFPYYVQASLIAKRNQKQFYRAGRFIYLLSALAVGCVAVAVLVETIAAAGFAAEFILLAITWYALQRSHRLGSHQAWMENRFLAERIRAGTFLAICGIDAAPIEVLPFMGHAHTVDDWMVRVYDEIWNGLPRLTRCTESQCVPLNQYIREQWIQFQVSFHRGKRERERNARIRLEKAAHIVLPITMAAAGFHIVLTFLPEPIQRLRWLGGSLTFIALLFPAVAASLAGMLAQREHLRLEKRSESMAPQLEYLSRRLASATDPGTFEALLHQVDEVMLRETQDWLMLMRFVVVRH